jgi:serine/threonine-protein kinase
VTLPGAAQWQRLSPLLDELLDLAPAARAERLRRLAADDAALAGALAPLLAATEAAQDARFLAGVAGGLPGVDAIPTLHGQRIGEAWTLLGPLGQGGTGSVWRARRTDGRFEGEAAIKLLHLSLLGRAEGERFKREGAILARLAHPHIARLLDAGVGETGQPYLVLELVDGERIDRHCDARRLTIAERLALFGDVLAAVAHAHSHLVIHRDLKPTNIMVAHDGSVKLLDFGIAKLIEDEGMAGEATQITREAGRALTPEYAAPEQLRGEPVTTATDVYALGVLLFHLLGGGHPTAPEGAGTHELVRTTLDVEPARLGSAAKAVSAEGLAALAEQRSTTPAALARELSGDLENIVAKALRKLPGERYATVDALAADLRRYLAHEPVSARADSLLYRARKFVRRHRRGVAVAAFTGLAIVAGLVGTITQTIRAERQARQAQIERDKAVHDAAFANGAHDLLGFLLGQMHNKPQTASELLAHAETLTERQFAADPLTRGRIQLMLGVEYGNVMESSKSTEVLKRAQASALAAGDKGLQSNIDCLLAATLGDQNEPQRALALFAAALTRLPADAAEANSVRWVCLQMRADLHANMGNSQAMLDDAQAALATLGTPRQDQRLGANSLRITVAEAYGRLGQTRKAIDAYEASLADLAGMGREQSARMAIRLNNFGRMLFEAGLTSRAQQAAARGIETGGGVSDATEMNAVLEANAARALAELGRHAEAQALAEHALASAVARKDTRWTGLIALYGAPAWCATGDVARCASLLATARDKLGQSLPASHPALAILRYEEGRLALAQQQPAEARERLAQAVSAFDAASQKSPLRISALALLARTEQQLGDLDGAARDAAAAVAAAREVSKGFDSTDWLGRALLAQGLVPRARGDTAGAHATLGQALEQLKGALGEDAPALREARALVAGG